MNVMVGEGEKKMYPGKGKRPYLCIGSGKGKKGRKATDTTYYKQNIQDVSPIIQHQLVCSSHSPCSSHPKLGKLRRQPDGWVLPIWFYLQRLLDKISEYEFIDMLGSWLLSSLMQAARN